MRSKEDKKRARAHQKLKPEVKTCRRQQREKIRNFATIFANCAKTKGRILSILTDFDSALKILRNTLFLHQTTYTFKHNFRRANLAQKVANCRARSLTGLLCTACDSRVLSKYTLSHQFRSAGLSFQKQYRALLRDQTNIIITTITPEQDIRLILKP